MSVTGSYTEDEPGMVANSNPRFFKRDFNNLQVFFYSLKWYYDQTFTPCFFSVSQNSMKENAVYRFSNICISS